MNESTTMLKQKIAFMLLAAAFSFSAFAQPTHTITDPEKKYKDAKELFVRDQFALAYPLFAELRAENPANTISNHTYINDDVNYYYIACELKLQQPIAEQEAKHYIEVVSNEPRRQLLSYHLAKYYFIKEDFSNAIDYYERAGLENLTNEEIADAKFEKAYCYFNLKQFEVAKPLFDEIHQMPDNKYYVPANYYYGVISYSNRNYAEALRSFKLVETQEEYKGVVPYYIAEIYYFQGKKDEALRYGESVLARQGTLFYQKEMNLLIGQLYYEKKNYQKALPLLEAYVNSSETVSKEIMYELSYCYYDANKLDKAIEGFKQLSTEKDSMGQNSMYLLGDSYLRTNQKANARNAFQYSAYNNSNKLQQQISRFTYAKLSYELGYQDIALSEMKRYINDYPISDYDTEAKEILVSLMANTNNFADALQLYESFDKPTASMQKVYPRILYGRGVELINDQQVQKADELFTKVLALPNSSVTPYANFWKGEIAYRNNEYDNAIKYLTFYTQANVPALGEANKNTANYDLGYSWFQKENYTKALGYFELVAKNVTVTSPAMEQDAYVRSADSYFMKSDFTKANSMYDHVINNALPQSDYAMFQKSMIAGVKSSSNKIATLNTLIKQYPKSNLVADANMEIAQTYIDDEKFLSAVPYLTNVLNDPEAGGLKPRAYLKLGLSYYNADKYEDALVNYQALVDKYPQSSEAGEATDIMKNIYVETGKPNEYIEMMRRSGKNISVSEADSLTYTAAGLKYNANNCAAAIEGFRNYLSKFPNGAYVLEANYFSSECYNAGKDFQNALVGYDYVNSKGISRFFEKATLEAARISYFELKDYTKAKKYFESLSTGAINQDNQLEALRGLVRTYYQLKDYAQANTAAADLLTKKGLSTDDKSIAFLVLGKSQQLNNDCPAAISSFKSAAAINKAGWGAEARYEIANCQFSLNNLPVAEKSALAVIKETGSYDMWVTKSYILLGDIFMQQKDYFN
ncbi:MAG: tetratricopeptide repeat protein, partial [Ferruginibacter sp.]